MKTKQSESLALTKIRKKKLFVRLAPLAVFCFIYFISMAVQPLLAQTSWKGTVSTSWSTATNWTNGVPTAAVDAIIGDASFTGAFQPNLTGGSAICKSLTLGSGAKSSTLIIDKNLTVNENVTIGSNGTIDHASNIITVLGNWTNSGSYTASQANASVTFAGITQSITGATSFKRLIINAGSITTLNANISVTKSVSVSGILDPGVYLVSFTGGSSFTVNSEGVIKVKASTYAGNYSINAILSQGSIVEYASASINQTIAVLTYSTLRISGATVKTLAGNITLLSSTSTIGNLEVNSGTLNLATYTLNRGISVSGGSITIGSSGTLQIGGINTFPSNYAVSNLATLSTVEYNGTTQTISNQLYGNLTLGSSSGAAVKTMPASAMVIANDFTSTVGSGTSVSYTAGAGITVNGNKTIGASTTFNSGAFTHSISGNWTNNGTFTGSTGTITMIGTSKSIGGSSTTSFNNLTISGFGITASATSLTVSGNFTTSGSGTFVHNTGGTLTMSGSSKIISGTSITFNNLTISGSISTTSSFLLSGNLAVTGTLNATAGTIEMNGTGRTISGAGTISLFGFRATGTVSTAISITLKSDLMGLGKLTATAGTLSLTGATTYAGTHDLFNITLNGTSLQLGANSTLGVAGTFTLAAGNFDVTTTTPNTVTYNSSGAQTITSTTYNNITLSTGNTKTAAGNLTANHLTINSGVTFSPGAYTHTVNGNWINNGTFTSGSSTIQLAGGLDTNITGATTFNILTLNKSTSANFVSLVNNVSVSTLNMTSGELRTGSNAVTITSARTGNGMITGTITRTHAYSSGVAYAFASPYNTINFTAIVGSVSSVSVTVYPASQDAAPLSGGINRMYTISLSNSGSYVATLRLHYLDGELSGNTESGLELWRYVSSWVKSGKVSNDATNNWVENSSVTDITNRWTLSNDNTISIWKGTTSSAWETASNWKSGSVPAADDLIQIGTETFTNQPVISATISAKALTFGSVQAATLTLGSGGSLTINGNINGAWTADAAHTINIGSGTLTVGGDVIQSYGVASRAIHLTLGSGLLSINGTLTQPTGANVTFTDAGNLTIGNNYNYTGGTFTAGTGTVSYTGSSSQIVASLLYNNLSFNKTAGAASVAAPLTINGNLLLSNGGALNVNADVTVVGNVTISSGVTVNENGVTITVGGHWIKSGSFNPTTGTLVFNGSGNQTISATTFNKLTVAKSGGVASLSGNLVINGNLTLTAGTLDLSTYTANRSIVGGILTLGSNSILKVGGATNFPLNFNVKTIMASSTVEYNGTMAQAILPLVYGNLTLSNGSNIKSLSGTTTVSGNLLVNTDASLLANSNTLILQGNVTTSGTFIPSTGSVVLAGTDKAITGNTNFNNLIITGSYTASAGTNLNMEGNADVSGSYTAGTNNVMAAGDVTISGTYSTDGITTYTGLRAQTVRLTGSFLSPLSQGSVIFDGTVAPVFNSTATPVFLYLTINNTSTIRPSVGWVVVKEFNISPGSTFDGSTLTHTFYGPVNNNGSMISSGTLNFIPAPPYTSASSVEINSGSQSSFESTGTVVFGGSRQIIIGGTPSLFNNVTISNTHAAGITPIGDWNVAGEFIVKTGSIFNAGELFSHTLGNDLDVSGTFNGGTSTVTMNPLDSVDYISGSGSITFNHLIIEGNIAALTDFNVSGNFTNNSVFAPDNSDITFNGASPSVIGGTTNPTPFADLIINKQSSTVSLAVGISELSSLIVSGGTFEDSGLSIQENIIGGLLSVNSGATFKIDSVNTLPVFSNGYSFNTSSTVEYTGTTQAISQQQYGNLTLSNAGVKSLATGTTQATTLTNSATLAMPGGSVLQLSGDWINNGTLQAESASTVKFAGQGIQNISGTTVTNFKNIEVTNTADPGVRVQSNQKLAGVLTLGTNGVFDPDGSSNTTIFTMLSQGDNPTSDASIGPLPSGARVDGKITVQRYMTKAEGNNGKLYRYISSPLQNATVADIQNELPVTGTFTGRSVCSGCGTYVSLYYYDETVITSNGGYIKFPSATSSEIFQPGRGYALYVYGNLLTSTLWDVRGNINAGNFTPVSLPVSFTSSGTAANDGWNLVGNPFPSTVDWNSAGWTKTNLENAIYITDNGSGTLRYATYNGLFGLNGGSQYIALGQAFWIKASGAGTPVLTANENAKAAGTQTTFFRVSSPENFLRITLVKGSITDETIVHFRSDATSSFESNLDARKFMNTSDNLSSLLADGSKLAINSLPALNCQASVKLSIDDVINGTYRFDFTELDSFLPTVAIMLVDKFLNKTVDIRNGSYTFSVTSNANSKGSARFELILSTTAPASTFTLSTLPVCEGADASIQILNSQNGIDYAGIIAGTTVTQSVKGNGGTIKISIPKNKLLTGENTVTINASIPDCSNRIQKNIVVTVNPTTIPSVENGVVCKQGVITLKATGAMQNGSYRWYESQTSSEAIAGQQTATLITPVLTTSKTYYVSIINSLGCEGARTPVTANVIQYNEAAIAEDAGLLTSNYSIGNQWYLNGEVIAGATNQTFRAEASGLYKVEVKVGSCSTWAELSVVIICTAPASTFTLFTLPLCEGVDAFIQILNSQNGADYSGMIAGTIATQSVKGNGGTIQISIPKNKLLAGQNTVTINASVPDCSNLIQKNIVVTVNPTTIASVENGAACREGVITLKATGAMQNGSYQWYESLASSEAIAGQHTATLITPVLTTSKTYYVSIINSFGCEGARTPVTANVIQYNEAALAEEVGVLTSNYSQGNQWYLNGEVIAGATNQTLRAEASGLYKVEVKVGSCITWAELSMAITSLKGSDETIISIFPNPVVSTVLIEIPDSFENWHSVKLLTSTGAELESEKLIHADGMKRFEMDMQKYAPGVYIITIMGNSKVSHTKIIKQ